MDRFDSREDADWSKYPLYQAGYTARNEGKRLDDCPHPHGSYQEQLWQAGWADADMGIISDQEAA